jgi:hypothetical protein
LAAQGYDLILVARRGDRLRALAAELPTHADVLVADLATNEGILATERAITACLDLQLLVNNAGFGTIGRFWESDITGQERMYLVHVIAVAGLTHAALRCMVPRGKGAVINVASVAGFGQSAGNVSYCSTKAWMNSFTIGLDLELRSVGSPVRVQALCPGFTETEFHGTLFNTTDTAGREGIPRFLWLKADYVVETSLNALKRRNPIVVPGWIYKIAVFLMTYLPGAITRNVRPGNKHRV